MTTTTTGYAVLRSTEREHYSIVRDCSLCGEPAQVQVTAQGLWDWEHGALIQDAFPAMSPADRETVKSGIHGSCWTNMFGH